TLSLQAAHCVVTDAVDGKHSTISSADEAWQQRHAVLNPAIMIEQSTACALHDDSELRDMVGATTDVKHLGTPELRRAGIAIFRNPAIELSFEQCQFTPQPFALILQIAPGIFRLRGRQRC